jgi:hypothetical protein
MLEVLKQLQVKPLMARVQVEICNQNHAGHRPFLGDLHLAVLSYRQTGKVPNQSLKSCCSNAPALSRENAAST